MDILQELHRIHGFDHILKKVNQLFSSRYKYQLNYLVDGIRVISSLPYNMEMKYFEGNGWNLFLISPNDNYPVDKPSFSIYEELAQTLQSLNLKEFGYIYREGFIQEFWQIA